MYQLILKKKKRFRLFFIKIIFGIFAVDDHREIIEFSIEIIKREMRIELILLLIFMN